MKIHHLAIRYSLVIIGIIFLALMIIDFNSRMAELRRLTAESQVVEQRLVSEAGTQVSLQTQIADASSDHASSANGHMRTAWSVQVILRYSRCSRLTSTSHLRRPGSLLKPQSLMLTAGGIYSPSLSRLPARNRISSVLFRASHQDYPFQSYKSMLNFE